MIFSLTLNKTKEFQMVYLCLVHMAERMRLPSRSPLGWCPYGCVFLRWPALVCRCHCHLYCPHWLSKDGEWVKCSGRTTSVPRGQVSPQKNSGNNPFMLLLAMSQRHKMWEMCETDTWYCCLFMHVLFPESKELRGLWCLFSLECPSSSHQY